MTDLGKQNRGRAQVSGILAWLVAAAVCVACSSGGGKSDASATSGHGGANAGSGGANAGSGGANAGSGGASAGSGGASAAGAGGTGGSVAGTCTFDVQHTPSPAIGTVEIVTWTLDVADLTEARIDFGPSGAAPTMTAPVDLREPRHRTVLVGMKAAKPYTLRVVATAGAKTCTSPDFSFTTGALPSTLAKVTTTKARPGAGAKGFIVTTGGIGSAFSSAPDAYIIDTDGDLVWWTYAAGVSGASEGVSRAHLSWDAKALWVMTSSTAKIMSVSMDGLTVTDYSNTAPMAHHDFAVLPGGGFATMLGRRGSPTGHSIIEVKADGTVIPIVTDLGTLYRGAGFYPNAIHYFPPDDSYTMGDRSLNLFVKFRRNGALVWQLGGSNPVGKTFTLVGLDQWMINHGHHLTADGHFLLFNNYGPATDSTGVGLPRVLDLLLDDAAGTATKTWEYQPTTGQTSALGDVERLPNGNVLLSCTGEVTEVDRSGTVVQSFKYGFGYVDFRTSLYGPPPR